MTPNMWTVDEDAIIPAIQLIKAPEIRALKKMGRGRLFGWEDTMEAHMFFERALSDYLTPSAKVAIKQVASPGSAATVFRTKLWELKDACTQRKPVVHSNP